jgi:hypothetical protein
VLAQPCCDRAAFVGCDENEAYLPARQWAHVQPDGGLTPSKPDTSATSDPSLGRSDLRVEELDMMDAGVKDG